MKIRSALSAAFAALFAACSAPPYPVRSIEDDAEAYASVVAADESLADIVRVGRPRVTRAAGNRLSVAVPIRNIDDEQVQILAQIEFRGDDQEPLGDSTNRQVMTIAAGATEMMTSTSRSDAARDYVVRLFWNK
ncbi:MAG: hypothetical protein Fur0037_26750 [Planctomycetota bacterium]